MKRIRPPREPRGFSGVEVLVVLAVLGILAGAGYAAAGQHRARAAEAEMRQDLAHFVNQQQVLRQRTGSLGTLAQLDGIGFQRSPGVIVEEDSVDAAGRRAYLRVRHRKSGQRCSVDYSPFVSNALNRIQCWGGPDDPNASERATPGEIAVTEPGGTIDVDEPTPPVATDACAGVPVLGVTAPADQSGPPGSARTGIFTLANPGTDARTYSLRFSTSNPAVVPSVDGPASVAVPAGATRTVSAAFQVDSSAEAGQQSVLPLEATDAACAERVGSGFFSVAAELWMMDPEVSHPADVTVRPGAPIPVTWSSTNRTNAPRMLVLTPSEQAGLLREGAAGSGNQPYGRGETRQSALEYRLDSEIDGFERRQACLEVHDAETPAYRAQKCFWATAEFIARTPLVRAPAARDAGQDEQFTSEWTVVNTSNAPRPFRIVPAATGDLVLVGAEGAGTSVILPRGRPHTVRVTYRLRRPSLAGTVSRATLQAADVDAQSGASAELVVTTRLEICAPAVAAAPADRTELPGASFSTTWQVQNCTNAPRDLTLAPAGDGDVLAGGTARVESFRAFEVRSVTLPFRVKERSVHLTASRPAFQASDADAANSSPFGVTTALALCAPTLSGPIGVPAQPQLPGTAATVGYTIQNCSNSPRTFSAAVGSSNVSAVPDPADPAQVAIPAYASASVSFAYAIPVDAPGGIPTDLAVRVEDVGETSLFAAGGFRVTPRVIRSAPLISAFPAQQLLPAQSGSAAATLTSQSNVPVRYCFTTTVSAGSVAAGRVVSPAPSAPGCVEIAAPFGTATVSQALAVAADAEHPWTNQVTVTAVDQADGSITTSQTFPVTAALQMANPTVRVPATPPAVQWRGGQTRSMEYRVGNLTNATRTLCVAVSTSDEALLSSASENPVCASVGARQSYTFSHVLKAATRVPGSRDATVGVQAYDQEMDSFRAAGEYAGRVISTNPVAVWTSPGSVYIRRWVDFNASDSYSPVGTGIVKYIWTWGLEGLHWDGVRFVVGGTGLAADSSASATVRRAFDAKGTFEICLMVVDADGLSSEPNCKPVSTIIMTRARLQWRYRGWMHEPTGFCWDVAWDDQCSHPSGNSRWEVLLNASQGDVPIRRAWTTISVKWWNTDDPLEEESRTYTYAGNTLPATGYVYDQRGSTRSYDFFSNDQRAFRNIQSGIWRVLDTEGSAVGGWPQAPDLARHPLVLNANLGRATGVLDGGPHWVPDNARVTLYVEDASGKITWQSGFYDHTRAEWRGSDCIGGTSGYLCRRGFERLMPPPSAPTGEIGVEVIHGVHRMTGSGQSADGRIIDTYWEINEQSLEPGAGPGKSYTSRDGVLEISPEPCVEKHISLILVDDQGQVGSAFHLVPSIGRVKECFATRGAESPGSAY
ncbi:MAG TPA: prepilin-type N-terminal cleavage/methylation domain-containing protein [Longimicrobium sp.]|jgi:prepilin-type N-terminal cleavage/methylation domain-containing protein